MDWGKIWETLKENPIAKEVWHILEAALLDWYLFGKLFQKKADGTRGPTEYDDEEVYRRTIARLREDWRGQYDSAGKSKESLVDSVDEFFTNHASAREAYIFRMCLKIMPDDEERLNVMRDFAEANLAGKKAKVGSITHHAAVVEWAQKRFIDSLERMRETRRILPINTARELHQLSQTLGWIERLQLSLSLGSIESDKKRTTAIDEILALPADDRYEALRARGYISASFVRSVREALATASGPVVIAAQTVLNTVWSAWPPVAAAAQAVGNAVADAAPYVGQAAWYGFLGSTALTVLCTLMIVLAAGISAIGIWTSSPWCYIVALGLTVVAVFPYSALHRLLIAIAGGYNRRGVRAAFADFIRTITGPPMVLLMIHYLLWVINPINYKGLVILFFVSLVLLAIFSWRYGWEPVAFRPIVAWSLGIVIAASLFMVLGSNLAPNQFVWFDEWRANGPGAAQVRYLASGTVCYRDEDNSPDFISAVVAGDNWAVYLTGLNRKVDLETYFQVYKPNQFGELRRGSAQVLWVSSRKLLTTPIRPPLGTVATSISPGRAMTMAQWVTLPVGGPYYRGNGQPDLSAPYTLDIQYQGEVVGSAMVGGRVYQKIKIQSRGRDYFLWK